MISDPLLISKLGELHSAQTGGRLGKIPLVLGMPVMITTNFDVEGGIVNGSRGILKHIRYYEDKDGNRHATSCVVEVADTSSNALPHLKEHEAVAIQDSVEIVLKHPH
ncbi:hypothetical protein BOTBODRAFT_110989, partial [Botryobasidium botryosum FD-172 SS1]